jgi:hypothetical protein
MSYNEMYLLALSGFALLSVAAIIFTVSKSAKYPLRFYKGDKKN